MQSSTVGNADLVADALRTEVAGVLDPAALGQRAAQVIATRLGLPMVSLALRQGPQYAMRCSWGTRTESFRLIRLFPGLGLGGRALAVEDTVTVEDYGTDEQITTHFRATVGGEGLQGVTAVLVCTPDGPVAVIYAARREWGRPDDRTIDALGASAAVLGPMLSAAVAAEEQTQLRVGQERQRIAGVLHDDIGQLLFAISAAARRARELDRERDQALSTVIGRIGQLADEATGRLREHLRAMTPTAPFDRLPVAVQRDLDDLADRSGIATHLVLAGSPVLLPTPVERAVLSCLRQAFFNVERHAMASLVIATLDFQPGQVALVVQDDGVGLRAGTEPQALPEQQGSRWGFASMLRQVEQLGGTVELDNIEDGGARLRVRLPVAG